MTLGQVVKNFARQNVANCAFVCVCACVGVCTCVLPHHSRIRHTSPYNVYIKYKFIIYQYIFIIYII